MSTFLLVISFILHVVTFLCIVLLYFKIEKMRDIERSQSSMMKDMEDLLSSYVLEIKEENEKFLQEVKQNEINPLKPNIKQPTENINKKTKSKSSLLASSIDTIENQLTEADLLELLPSFKEEEKVATQETKTNYINPVREEQEKPKEPPFDSLPLGKQVKILNEEGRSIEEIAKKLNKGKTEIELFLKFNQ